MDAATIEETNKLRASMGLPLLPVPGAAPPPVQAKENDSDDSENDGEEEASTIETREAKAYDNFKAIRDAEEAKRKREARAAAVKRERDNAQRFATLEGKGLGEADDAGDVDAKAWLKASRKRQKLIDQNRKLEEEREAADAAAAAALQYTSKDLAGIKVAHDMSDLLGGDDQILTLKDTTIDENEEEGDELENLDAKARESLKERLELKKKKPAYNVHDGMEESGERGLLSQYDEEIYGKKGKKFTLDGSGAIAELSDILDGDAPKPKRLQAVSLDDITKDAPMSDYLDISEIKVKKPKKKKSKNTRQKPVDEDDVFPIPEAPIEDEAMDVDAGNGINNKKRRLDDDEPLVDDDDLQASLAIQRRNALKKRKKTRPEDIARQLKEQAEQVEPETNEGGVVIDDISEFVSGLRKPEDDASKKAAKPKPKVEDSVTAMDDQSDDDGDHEMADEPYAEAVEGQKEESPSFDTMGIDEERTIGLGMGSTLSLLKERGLLQDSHGAELNDHLRNKAEFVSQLRRIEGEQEERTRQQREKDRLSGRWDRMSIREREEWARQQNTHRDQQQSRNHGRSLNQKEAFKHLSHQFHGKTSGKGKTDKRLKKIEAEKKRESESFLDASQNATSQKRKEAGVRLQ
ncbi:U4/U6.U5 tri-snRNP-associated protein snu66 [Plectosphaerella plurivora]|uniref:U4/U6.U5 tri-snRNP-associated protein snu66 n=1 Tax=Plectosphaerella plurivora TaxID=936078 RepID=A0A9P9A7F7_9PEZI|nr:U4/U6.U5 tri-snRNP-associated protein snu66 [Plectosphaerella plurivora]